MSDSRSASAGAPPSAVFLNRFYWPDVAATGQMLTDLAEDLVAAGWTVTVVTGAGDYDAATTATPLPRDEVHNGVRIIRVAGTRFGRHRTMGRLLDYATYFIGALLRVLALPATDFVVAMSDPPFVVAIAVLAAKLKGVRSVYWVQDLFPQIAARLGVMDERTVTYRAADRFARALNRCCDRVVALGPRMARALWDAGARPECTVVAHNWADAAAIVPVSRSDNPFVRAHGVMDKFVVLYSGNAGRAHTFDAVLGAARILSDDDDIVFLFVGGGKRLAELRAAAARDALGNVRFLDYVPRGELAFSLSAADVSLVTEDPAVEGLLVPSKTYGILASGRPVLFVGSPTADAACMIADADCGVVTAPDDAPALVRAIRALRDDPARREQLGANARRAAERTYDRRLATARWATAALATTESDSSERSLQLNEVPT